MPVTRNTPTQTKLPPPVTEGGAHLEISMGLPVRALSDEELIHYAGIDEDARIEMARRSVEHRGTYLSELTLLKQDIEDLESQLEEAAEAESSADDMQDCIQRVFDLLKGYESMDQGEAFEAIEAALAEISDFAR